MNKIIYSLLFIAIFCFGSCAEQLPHSPIEHFSDVPSVDLECVVDVDLEKYNILRPFNVLVYNDWIFFVDYGDKQSLLKCIKDDYSKVICGIREGNGPFDVIGAFDIMVVDDNIVLNDYNHKRLFDCSIDHNDSLVLKEVRRNYSLSLGAVFVNSNTFIELAGFTDSVFYRYVDYSLQSVLFEQPYPDDDVLSSLNMIAQASIYLNTKISVSPDRTKFAWGVNYSQKMGFGKIVGDSLHLGKVLTYSSVKIGSIGSYGVIVPAKDSKRNIAACTSTNDYVLFLFWDSEYGDLEHFYAQDILVYKWDGTPYKHFKVKEKLMDIKYNSKNHTLYGIAYSPDAHYVEYSLNGIL